MHNDATKYQENLLSSAGRWETVLQFAEWYRKNGLPFMPAAGSHVITTDDAVAFPIFKYKNFQVELYVFTPSTVPKHSHPFVDVAQSYFDAESGTWSSFVELIYPKTHGGTDIIEKETLQQNKQLLLVFQKWPVGVNPCTLSAVWKGNTMGKMQEGLIRKFFPQAKIENGYADITVKADALEIL
jgi:hypothetical protein